MAGTRVMESDEFLIRGPADIELDVVRFGRDSLPAGFHGAVFRAGVRGYFYLVSGHVDDPGWCSWRADERGHEGVGDRECAQRPVPHDRVERQGAPHRPGHVQARHRRVLVPRGPDRHALEMPGAARSEHQRRDQEVGTAVVGIEGIRDGLVADDRGLDGVFAEQAESLSPRRRSAARGWPPRRRPGPCGPDLLVDHRERGDEEGLPGQAPPGSRHGWASTLRR